MSVSTINLGPTIVGVLKTSGGEIYHVTEVPGYGLRLRMVGHPKRNIPAMGIFPESVNSVTIRFDPERQDVPS